jgi:hypothetical protein
MTYSEKIKELHNTTVNNMREYAGYARELRLQIDQGVALSKEQFSRQEVLFSQFQDSMRSYNDLIGFVTKNKVRFDSEYLPPDPGGLKSSVRDN